MVAALVPVGLVVLAVVALVVVKAAGGSSGTPAASKVAVGSGAAATSAGTSALPAGVLAGVTSVSPTTLSAIGEPSATAAPIATGAKTALTASNGKPEILFIGSEYCPFCAAQRWSVVEALSRFGTFSGLSATHSSTSDIYPDTQTFSFYGATYTSTSLAFTSVELQTNQASGDSYTTLQTPTSAEDALLSKYDKAPYHPDRQHPLPRYRQQVHKRGGGLHAAGAARTEHETDRRATERQEQHGGHRHRW